MSDRIAVMYAGKIVELGITEDLLSKPAHPYTNLLLSAVPTPDTKVYRRHVRKSGAVPNPVDFPSGCRFHPRCEYAQEICSNDEPKLGKTPSGRHIACHFPLNLE